MPETSEPTPPEREENLGSLEANLASRRAKLSRIRQRGIDPYPPRVRRDCTAAEAVARFEEAEAAGQTDSVAGLHPGRPHRPPCASWVRARLPGPARRLGGWCRPCSARNVLGDEYTLLQDLDLGDFLGVSGDMMRTRTGQPTIEALSLTVLAKGMRPLPEKWHGLRDVENPLPPTLPGPHRQPGGRRNLRPAQPHHQRHSSVL